jgi:hypothetical protein
MTKNRSLAMMLAVCSAVASSACAADALEGDEELVLLDATADALVMAGAGEEDVASESAELLAVEMSAAEFRQKYCPNMTYCWVNETSNKRFQERAKGVDIFVFPINGTIHLKVQRWENGAWDVKKSIELAAGLPNAWHYIYRWGGDPQHIRVEVLDSVNERFHIALRYLN